MRDKLKEADELVVASGKLAEPLSGARFTQFFRDLELLMERLAGFDRVALEHYCEKHRRRNGKTT